MTSTFLPPTVSPCCFMYVLMPAWNSWPTLENAPEKGAMTPTLIGCWANAVAAAVVSAAVASTVVNRCVNRIVDLLFQCPTARRRLRLDHMSSHAVGELVLV